MTKEIKLVFDWCYDLVAKDFHDEHFVLMTVFLF